MNYDLPFILLVHVVHTKRPQYAILKNYTISFTNFMDYINTICKNITKKNSNYSNIGSSLFKSLLLNFCNKKTSHWDVFLVAMRRKGLEPSRPCGH